MLAVLTCPHHVQWIRRVPGGLHQCIQCYRVVSKAEVYPKLEDLSEELRRQWDEHEARRDAPADVPVPPAGKAGGQGAR